MKDFLKYVLATVTGILMVAIVMGILGVISLVGLAASSASTTEVEDNSVFVLSLSGTLEERAKDDPLAFLTGQVSENLGLDKILASIQKAKDNENIKGIYIEAGAFAAGSPASMHAIREALLDFKKSGKCCLWRQLHTGSLLYQFGSRQGVYESARNGRLARTGWRDILSA